MTFLRSLAVVTFFGDVLGDLSTAFLAGDLTATFLAGDLAAFLAGDLAAAFLGGIVLFNNFFFRAFRYRNRFLYLQ
jgi:hypothetical protein